MMYTVTFEIYTEELWFTAEVHTMEPSRVYYTLAAMPHVRNIHIS